MQVVARPGPDPRVPFLESLNAELKAKADALALENEKLAAENHALKASIAAFETQGEALRRKALERKYREMRMREVIGDTQEFTEPSIPPPDSTSPDW